MHFCFYHGNCPDGLTSAAVVDRYLTRVAGVSRDAIRFIPASHNRDIEIDFQDVQAMEVAYFVDFCPKTEQIHQVTNPDTRIVIIDHHATARDGLESLMSEVDRPDLKTVFDMSHSGASLCWNYFFGDEPVPELIKDIRDIDLWLWQRQDTDVSYGISQHVAMENRIEAVAELMEPEAYQQALPMARTLAKFHFELAQGQAKSAVNCEVKIIDGKGQSVWSSHQPIPVIATDPATASLALAKAACSGEAGMAIGFWTVEGRSGTLIKISVRSVEGVSTLDVTQALGGGGHVKASGALAMSATLGRDTFGNPKLLLVAA